MKNIKLSLGPLHYYWNAGKVKYFYEQVEDWPVDIVYLGETVCAKRRAMKLTNWIDIAEKLTSAGKEVVFSTLALLEAESELSGMKHICENGDYAVEANDMAAVSMLEANAEFVVGPHINCYNIDTLLLLKECGAKRWVMPMELNANILSELQAGIPSDLQTEVFVYGYIPLSFSARCFTARAYNLPKDQCGFLCSEDPHGMPLHSQDGDLIFTINGIQLQSGLPCNLLGEVNKLRDMHVDVLRISPCAYDMKPVVHAFRDVIENKIDIAGAEKILAARTKSKKWCNGYWHGKPGMAWVGDTADTISC